MGEMRKSYIVLVGNPQGKRPLGRPVRRWKDNINLELQKQAVIMRTRSKWLRIGPSGGLL
jgi:hypothetical protein